MKTAYSLHEKQFNFVLSFITETAYTLSFIIISDYAISCK